MASTSKDQQPGINLASKMEKTKVMSVKMIKALIASNPQDFDVNGRNERGKTALMFACMRVDMKVVQFLLDQGADPNSQCDEGNTPMHYAVSPSCCSHGEEDEGSENIGKIERRLEILRLLINHGATSMYNSKGLNPSCLAALLKQWDLVNFFVQRNTRYLQLSDEEQIRALEILGVAMALDSLQSIGQSTIKDSTEYFSRARSIRKKMESNASPGENKASNLAAAFSLFSQKECSSEEWKSIQNDYWRIRTQAFLIAERVLPEDMKDDYLSRMLLLHARNGLFYSGHIEERRLQSIQIFQDAVQWELKSKYGLGTLLGCILDGFLKTVLENSRLHDEMKKCIPVMESCLQAFKRASRRRVREVQEQLLQKLGSLMFTLAMSRCNKSVAIFEALLPFGESLVKVIRKRCEGRKVTSITQHIILQCQGYFRGIRSSVQFNRVKCLISRLVQCEDATHCNDKGDTILHSLMRSYLSVPPDFLKDVALILIRNGCDPKKRNRLHETWEGKIRYLPYTLRPEYKELKELISSQTKSVLPLEEIAARTILRHSIHHEGILPKHLSRIVTGDSGLTDNCELDQKYNKVTDSEYGPDKDSDSDSEDDLELDEEYGSEYDFDSDAEYDSEFDSEYGWDYDSDSDSDGYFFDDDESSDYE